jgi:hypothetical protein
MKASKLLGAARRGELLVTIMNDRRDMAIAREKGWHPIPVRSVENRLNLNYLIHLGFKRDKLALCWTLKKTRQDTRRLSVGQDGSSI